MSNQINLWNVNQMKFLKFIYKIQKLAIYNVQIDNRTLQIFMTEFYSCLNVKEKNKYSFVLDLINSLTKKQSTIDSMLQKINVEKLEKTFNELKYSQPK